MRSASRVPHESRSQRYGYIHHPSSPHPSVSASAQPQPPQYRYENETDGFSESPPAPVGSDETLLDREAASDQYADEANVFGQDKALEQPLDEGSELDAAAAAAGAVAPAPHAHVPIPDDGGVAYQSRAQLYMTYALSAWGDRMWEFSAVLFIIDLFPTSLFYSAFFGLVENLVGIAFGPYVGGLIDRHDRRRAMRWAIVGQNVSIAVASFVFWMSLESIRVVIAPDGSSNTKTPAWIGMAYFFILCMGGVAKVASTAAKLSLHKDWVPVLAATDADRLTNLNSSMRRIDLTANILSPLLVGLISWGASPATAVAVIGLWSAVSLLVETKLVARVYGRIAALQYKPGVAEAEAARRSEAEPAVRGESSFMSRIATVPASVVQRVRDFALRFIESMKAYRAHPVYRASLAYAMLYISVLSLGGIMTSWLKLRGVSDAVLAGVRGVAAGVGVGATYASPWMIHRWGVVQAGLVAIWLQVLMLCPVAFAFIYYFRDVTTQLVIILVFLCLSRFGLWSFDLCQTQIMQRSVALQDTGAINGAQETLMNISYTAGFLLTIIFSNPAWFAAPAWISLLSVFAAAGVYTSYTADALHTDNPFPALATFKLHQHVHSDEAQAHPQAPAAPEADEAPQGGVAHSPASDDSNPHGAEDSNDQQQKEEPRYCGRQ